MKNLITSLKPSSKSTLATAVIFSSLFSMILLGYTFKAVNDFYAHKASVYPDMAFNTSRFLFFLRNVFKQEYIRLTTGKPDENSPLPAFHIYVDKNDIAKLDEDLPKSGWEQYVTAYMKTEQSDKLRRISIRYRGFSHYHWLYKKKSLRIKLEKGDLYNMERKFNLINMPSIFMTNEIVNYHYATQSGLMSPEYYPARVFINDEYMGVYMYLSQVEESFLRKHKRMPGSIYYGESPSISETKESLLWEKEEDWEKAASRSIEYEDDRSDIQLFIEAISNYSDIEFYDFFNSYADKEKFYAFFSLDTFFGGTHHDFYHNHKIYFDPYLGKFEPIAWDLRFWSNNLIKDTSFYPLLARIKLNPVLEYERDLAAYRFFKENDVETVLDMYEKQNQRVYKDMEKDIYKDTALYAAPFDYGAAVPYSMSNFDNSANSMKQTLRIRNKYLDKLYAETSAVFNFKKLDKNTLELTFKVSGNSPLQLDLLKALSNSSGKTPLIYRLPFTANKPGPGVRSTETLYPGRKYIEGNGLGSERIEMFGSKMLISAPLYYRYIIKGSNIDVPHEIPAVNAITGEQHTIKNRPFKTRQWADSIHPWDLPRKQLRNLTLSGLIEVNKTKVYDKHTRVRILPGTTFKLAPSASLVFNNRVTAIGSQTRPIIFKAKDIAAPWGSIIIQGRETSGSRFEHIRVSGGSKATHNLVNYPGQFNIHDSVDFTVTHCHMSDNSLGDDNMHVAYSSGVIKHCRFNNSASDALDVDISTVNIENNLFTNSGNDALDFMTSDATVKDNLIIQAGDKCISTGEWSFGEFSNNVFSQCNIGVEVKDKSTVSLSGSIIRDSRQVAINLYNKNLKYDSGGNISVRDSWVSGSKEISSDKHSSYTMENISGKPPEPDRFPFIKNWINGPYTWENINRLANEKQ